MTLARWIKYEEDLNAEKGQWGKPHVATLSFKALVNLRLCMEGGTLMLDVTVRDLPELLHRYRKFHENLRGLVGELKSHGSFQSLTFMASMNDQGGGRPKRALDN